MRAQFGDEATVVAGGTFVPYNAALRPAPGYIVPPTFWRYINRADLFPGAWLHDIGRVEYVSATDEESLAAWKLAAPRAGLNPATRLNSSVWPRPIASACAPPNESPAMAR